MKLTKTLGTAAAGVVLVAIGSGVTAEAAADWTLQPPAAFVDVYVYACQPVEYDFAGIRQDLDEAARQVHDDMRFLIDYGGSCRDFYFGEVVPRLDIELRPYFVPVSR